MPRDNSYPPLLQAIIIMYLHLSCQKEEQLDNKQFEDRSLEWKTLPSLSTDFDHWLQMKVCV